MDFRTTTAESTEQAFRRIEPPPTGSRDAQDPSDSVAINRQDRHSHATLVCCLSRLCGWNDRNHRRRFAIERLTWVSSGALGISFFILFAITAWGQQKSIAKGAIAVGPKPLFLLSISQSRSIPNGIELHSGAAIIQVVALREDVLRVRISSSGQLPEDAYGSFK